MISELKNFLIMKKSILLFSLFFLLTHCRKTPDFEKLSTEFIVSTSLDKTADFGSYKTFYISDTVAYVGGEKDGSVLVGQSARDMVKVVKDNLTARGYTFVSRSSMPDLGLTLSAVKDINVVVDYYPGWWDGYWPTCYWYYWCYGYYYPWTTVYSYTTGTVILNMYDLKNAAGKEQITGIWNTTALGALGSSNQTNVTLAIDALNQGFEQSPYIQSR